MTDSPDWTGNIQISGQSVVVNENISGQTVAVYSGSQYAPVQGNGVYLTGSVAITNSVLTALSYTVPAGKTFFMQGIGWGVYPSTVYDSVFMELDDGTTDMFRMIHLAGQQMIFDTPVPFAAGHIVTVSIGHATGTALTGYASLWGWLQ